MKTRLTLGRKLTVSFAVVLAATVAVGLSSLRSISRLGRSLDDAVNTTASKTNGVGEIRTGFQEIVAHTRCTHMAYVINHLERDGGQTAGMCSSCHSSELAAGARQAVSAGVAAVKARIDDMRELFQEAEDRETIEKVESGLNNWLPTYAEYVAAADADDFMKAHDVLTDKLHPLAAEIDVATRALITRQSSSLEAARETADSDVNTSQWVAIGLLGLNAVLLAGVLVVVWRSSGSLRRLVSELDEEAERVANAAQQVSVSSQALAQGASEQAASLEQTSASSEDVSTTAQKNAENAKAASDLTSKVTKGVARANQRLDLMVAAMQEISSSSEKISKIIQVINDIAFQTNILALNAAVEAARAGEAGMGFAVVADEVRNLSQRCAQAAQDTAALIEESISKSREGKATLDQVASAIQSITADNDAVRALAGTVEEGSLNQARGTEQILSAIHQMQRVTQESAASAEESASVGQELDAQAANLRRIVEDLTALVGSSMAARPLAD